MTLSAVPRDPPAEAPTLRRCTDLVAIATYLLLALYVTGRLWIDVPDRIAFAHAGDRAFAEWNLAAAARALTHLDNPLTSHQMNVPLGVNTMANTSMLGLGIPLAPVTLLFGPAASFDLAILIGLAGTAIAWYHVLSRHVVTSRAAAWIGGFICGYGPSLTSHADLHPNLVAQFVVPLIALHVMRLGADGHPVRRGIVLGVLVVYQAFLNEELLFFTVLACGLYIAVYALTRRHEIRPMVRPYLTGLGVAAAVALVALAYPLWWQFTGPGHYRGVAPIGGLSSDLLSYSSFASNSMAEQFSMAHQPWGTALEENTNFGLPLLVAAVIVTVWLWRRAMVRTAAVCGAVFAVLSLGPEVVLHRKPTGVPGPWAVLQRLPLFDSALPVRVGMVVTPLLAIVVACGFDRLSRLVPDVRRTALIAGLAVALLLPNAPTPGRAVGITPTPDFISHGMWRAYLSAGQSVLVVPTPSYSDPLPIFWSARDGLDLPLSHGYFLGPDATGRGRFGPDPRWTDKILDTARRSGITPAVTDQDRAHFREDLRYWRTGVIVFRPDPRYPPSLLATIEALTGRPGRWIGGVYVWDTRGDPAQVYARR